MNSGTISVTLTVFFVLVCFHIGFQFKKYRDRILNLEEVEISNVDLKKEKRAALKKYLLRSAFSMVIFILFALSLLIVKLGLI